MSSGDEVTALELLAAQKQIVQPLVQEFGGQWLKEMGEGENSRGIGHDGKGA